MIKYCIIVIIITGWLIHAAFKSHLWVPISHSSSSVQAGPESNLAEYPSSQRQVNDPIVLLQTPFPHTSLSLHSLISIQKQYHTFFIVYNIFYYFFEEIKSNRSKVFTYTRRTISSFE
jgi:hypothetical protein